MVTRSFVWLLINELEAWPRVAMVTETARTAGLEPVGMQICRRLQTQHDLHVLEHNKLQRWSHVTLIIHPKNKVLPWYHNTLRPLLQDQLLRIIP